MYVYWLLLLVSAGEIVSRLMPKLLKQPQSDSPIIPTLVSTLTVLHCLLTQQQAEGLLNHNQVSLHSKHE